MHDRRSEQQQQAHPTSAPHSRFWRHGENAQVRNMECRYQHPFSRVPFTLPDPGSRWGFWFKRLNRDSTVKPTSSSYATDETCIDRFVGILQDERRRCTIMRRETQDPSIGHTAQPLRVHHLWYSGDTHTRFHSTAARVLARWSECVNAQCWSSEGPEGSHRPATCPYTVIFTLQAIQT